MSYTHDQKFATQGKYWNLPDITCKGLCLHSVGCPQPKADVFAKNFNSPNARASIHGVIEPGRFIEMAPIFKTKGKVKKCYHVGSGSKGSRNSTHIGIEMTEPSTIKYTGGASFTDLNPAATKEFFLANTDTAAQVFADLCIFHGLTVNDITITTHRQSYLDGYGGNHGDPWHLWRFMGYDLAQFRKDVQKYIDAKKGDVLALMTKQEFEQILDQKLASVKPAVYQTIDDVPSYAKEVVQKLVDKGALAGTGGTVNGKPTLNLSYDLVRTLVILDRLGAFDVAKAVATTETATPKTTTKAAAATKTAAAVKANIK